MWTKNCQNTEIQAKSIRYFRDCRIFDLSQKSSLSRNITSYLATQDRANPSPPLLEEWARYYNCPFIFEAFEIEKFWESKKEEFLILARMARGAIWIQPAGADVDRSFSLLNIVECPRRSQLSDDSLKNAIYCYNNETW